MRLILVINLLAFTTWEASADLLQAVANLEQSGTVLEMDPAGHQVSAGGHLQGIQAISENEVIWSGSSSDDAYLALGKLGQSGWQVTRRISLMEKPYKHAGGFQVAGDYLAVGIEDNETKDRSKVWVLKLEDLLDGRPKPIIEIERQGEAKRVTAGAVGMAMVRDHHVIVVGSWDSATLDFYVTNGQSLERDEVTIELKHSWVAATANRDAWLDLDYGSYQNLNLIVDEKQSLYMLGFCQESAQHRLDVFRIDIEQGVLRKVAARKFDCRKGSFRAGAGSFFDASGALRVYSCQSNGWAVEVFGSIQK